MAKGNPLALLGQTFHRFTVLEKARPGYWLCLCECDSQRIVKGSHLVSGKSRSCGCLRLEELRKGFKHGLTSYGERHPVYEVWSSMRVRCNNPGHKSFHNYGGRGIKVCPRWDDFALFVQDMGERPAGYSIERINNFGDYTPENCRWANQQDQANNTRTNVQVTYQGKRQSIAQWARESGVPYRVLWERITLYKWPLERAFTAPVRRWP